jgi:aminoglycoside 6'-N-acetyltransferase I
VPVREIAESDRAEWVRLRDALWPGSLWDHDEETRRYFAARSSAMIVFVAETADRIVGFLEMDFRPYAPACLSSPVPFIEGWYVEPEWQHRGIGRALVEAAEARARAMGYTEIGSDAEIDNADGIAAHRAVGYEEVERIVCFRRSLVILCMVLGCAYGAAAQERTGTIYLMSGITMPYQSGATDESSELYIEAPGGTTLGWAAGAGVRVARNMSVEAEWSTTGWMRARERSRIGLTQTGTYIEERRDRFVLFAARFHFRRTRTVGVEPLVGVAWTTPEGWSELEGDASSRQNVPLGRGVAPMCGWDLRLGNGRAAVLPSLRLFISGAGNHSDYPGGYPAVTLRVGAGVRVDLGRR